MHMITKTKQDESGFASITIALVLILVLALITIGFAQLSRREQQSALNKQLAAQANYAAESGINEVAKLIEQNPSAIPNSPNTCLSPSIIGGSPTSNQIDNTRDVLYTCALADLNPKSLEKDLAADTAWYTTFSTSPALSSLKITWQHNGSDAKSPKSAMPTGSEFQPPTSWGDSPAVLQVNITPLSGSRSDWVNRSFTVYLYPSTSAGNTVSYASNTQGGSVISGSCIPTTGVCNAKIDNLPTGAGSFLLHVVDYYDPSKIKVTGTNGSDDVEFNNAQAVVDVTGKARNVLKRLRVRIPLNQASPLPNYALEAKNICKRQQTSPAKTDYFSANGSAASSTSNTECFLGNTSTD